MRELHRPRQRKAVRDTECHVVADGFVEQPHAIDTFRHRDPEELLRTLRDLGREVVTRKQRTDGNSFRLSHR